MPNQVTVKFMTTAAKLWPLKGVWLSESEEVTALGRVTLPIARLPMKWEGILAETDPNQ